MATVMVCSLTRRQGRVPDEQRRKEGVGADDVSLLSVSENDDARNDGMGHSYGTGSMVSCGLVGMVWVCALKIRWGGQ